MISKIQISVVIPNFNGAKFILECVLSVLREKNDNYEVIVVDDISSDLSVELLKKEFSSEKKVKIIVSKKKRGSAGTRNEGAKYARGKYLLFLDLDTTIQKDWFNKSVKFFDTHRNTALAQPKLLIRGTNKFDYAGDYLGPMGFLIERARASVDKGQFDQPSLIFSMKGAAMLTRTDVFKKLKGFDDDFEYLWEEPDYAWRVWLAGYEVRFMPQLTVWHAFGAKKQQYYFDNEVFYRGCRNNITAIIKNMGIKKLIFVLPLNILCWLILTMFFFTKLDFPKGFAIMHGLFKNIMIAPKTMRKRVSIQRKRVISDERLFSLIGTSKSFTYYITKAYTYVKQ